jgi:hypothetical protein
MPRKKITVPKEVKELVDAVAGAASGIKQPKGNPGHPGPIGRTVSPDVGKATQIKKGQRLPGAGRKPKPKPLTDDMLALLKRPIPAAYAEALKLKKGTKWVRAVNQMQLYNLLKAPNAAAYELHASRIEGPVPQEISGPNGGPIPMLNMDLDPADLKSDAIDQLRTVTSRIRDRLAATKSQS